MLSQHVHNHCLAEYASLRGHAAGKMGMTAKACDAGMGEGGGGEGETALGAGLLIVPGELCKRKTASWES